MPDALLLQGLTKRYGSVEALRGVDLTVAPGELFGFLGPNGAGKSTTIRIILDLIRPTAGRAAVFGIDCQHDSVEARRKIGYLQSDPAYPSGATALDVFEYNAALRAESLDRVYLDDLTTRLRLDPFRKVSDLSRGNRQKVGIVQALLTKAPLLVLDEPTTGLDPLVQDEVEALLREASADGRTIFFSSHILSEVQSLCSRAAIVRAGLIVQTVDLARERSIAPARVEVTFAAPPALDGIPEGVAVVERRERSLLLEARAEAMDALVKWLARYQVEHLTAREPTLDELFMRYYREAGSEALE
jgi:ABC-2 type transport system ATP-binding protein